MKVLILDTKETQKKCPKLVGKMCVCSSSARGWNTILLEDGDVLKLRSKSIEEIEEEKEEEEPQLEEQEDEDEDEDEEEEKEKEEKEEEEVISISFEGYKEKKEQDEIRQAERLARNQKKQLARSERKKKMRALKEASRKVSSFLDKLSNTQPFQSKFSLKIPDASDILEAERKAGNDVQSKRAKRRANKEAKRASQTGIVRLTPSFQHPSSSSSSSSSLMASKERVRLPSNEEAKQAIRDSRGQSERPKKKHFRQVGGQQDGWFNMKGEEFTDELRQDLKMIKMRGYLNPKKFYKKPDKFSKTLQVGTVVEGSKEGPGSRLGKRYRRSHLANEMLADPDVLDYSKRTYSKLQRERRRSAFSKNKRQRKGK